MKIKQLILNNFGPYSSFEVEFPSDNRAFVLITGKNNAGKTSLLRALMLVDGALKLATGSTSTIEKPLKVPYFKDLNLSRLIHGFVNGTADISAILDTGREIRIQVDSENWAITCNLPPRTPSSVKSLLGFMPPLGQIREDEQLLTLYNVQRYINTAVAPHHLRNHIYHFLDIGQRAQLKRIIYDTWNNTVLGDVGHDVSTNMLYCPYSEGQDTGEISFAGQGFQIWLQIMTHLLRLADCSTIILDEPEIYLHPEKQHTMIHAFRENFDGAMIIATHSSELMNEVDFSHIIHIQRGTHHSKFISTQNRDTLEDIRQEIGSSFNLVASQFEDVERLIFTENVQDYQTLSEIARQYGSSVRTHNIPIFGLSKWQDCSSYKNAYKMFFAREPRFSVMLDKDFYPKEHLDKIETELLRSGIRTTFTPGHELENLFIQQDLLLAVFPRKNHPELIRFLDSAYRDLHEPTLFKYVQSATKYFKGEEYYTVYERLKPSFDSVWNDISKRHRLPEGKQLLARIRQFAKDNAGITLSTSYLVQNLVETRNREARELYYQVYETPIP